MELPALSMLGARPQPVGASASARPSQTDGVADSRAPYLARLPSVEPGSLSAAYRSFRAHEARMMPATSGESPPQRTEALDIAERARGADVLAAMRAQPPVIGSAAGFPGALAAYGEVIADA